jgi:MFS family permease
VMAVATVGGPLIGGLLVDTSWLGWRWCFYVGVPFAAVALVLLQRTLHLPVVRREVSIDYLGATFLTAGVSALLSLVTIAAVVCIREVALRTESGDQRLRAGTDR